jgi:hypothetical protein
MMKKRLFFTGIIGLGLVFVLFFAGCPTDAGGGGGDSDTVVTTAAIGGVTAPAIGGTPVTAITATPQYTGTVSWTPTATTFAAGTAYTATITLKAETGYTFDGVAANFFTVAGATTVTNAADSGVVTAVFPATGAGGTVVDIAAIGGVTAPKTGETPVTAITATAQYVGTVSWEPTVTTTFAADTPYTATITLTAVTGYTFTGVKADFFTVAGATTVTNAADSGVVKAVFPKTGAGLTITAKSATSLEVVWPKSGDLAAATDYHVRYRQNDKNVAASTGVLAANITQPITGSFKADITGLTVNQVCTVWVFKKTDENTFTSATPLFTGEGTPVGSATVTLAPKSHGTAGANSITGLDAGAKYVVKEGNLWYPVERSGSLGNGTTLDEAVSKTVNGLATISNRDNTKTYNVFLVKDFPDREAILTSADTGNKNTIVDIELLRTSGTKFIISTQSAGATLIVFTNVFNDRAIDRVIAKGDVIGGGARAYEVTDALASAANIKIKAATTDKYAEIDLSGAVSGSVITFTVQ